MIEAIALVASEIPNAMTGEPELTRRAFRRGEQDEYRFLYADEAARLPIIRGGQLTVVQWGNGRGQSRYLPRVGSTGVDDVQQGFWREARPVPVLVPATFGLDRGRWFRIRVGIKGLLVADERGDMVAYLLHGPSSHYYKVMTGSDRMPVLEKAGFY
jgi:hypothetical protein